MDKKSLYLTAGVIAVVAVGSIVFLFVRSKPTEVQPPQPSPMTQAPANAPTIVKATMSRSIDAKGAAADTTMIFNSKTDKIFYAVLSLKNITKNTKLSYVRYLNGKYVDSKVALPTKDGITNFYFAFEKGIGDYPKGTYTLNLYVNGRRAQSLSYVFK